ncbi:spore coat protein [Brevibacillus dissolubilis]|uniref:spore coat protein n=1 Tax=Brevibacillus dissolubilis TaxID=1844116 RepID=UPI001116549C|nr:spore coat protein [Brevibacillus dissolubilis]
MAKKKATTKSQKWSALDPQTAQASSCNRDNSDDENVRLDAEQTVETTQTSNETILVRDSVGVTIHTTDTQAALAIQLAVQAAIAAIISITIADSDVAEEVTADLLESSSITQSNRQDIRVENSRDVNVTTTDTDLAANIQVLLQVLAAIIAKVDIL